MLTTKKALHTKFNDYRIKNEWFTYNGEIIKGFREFKLSVDSEIKKLKERIELLENRVNYLEKELNKNLSLQLNLEELNNIFAESFQKLQNIK